MGPYLSQVEWLPFKEFVGGSNPPGLTIFFLYMQKTQIKNIETGISKNCDILKKNDQFLEVVLEGTTIKILLKMKNKMYVGKFKDMEFISSGN